MHREQTDHGTFECSACVRHSEKFGRSLAQRRSISEKGEAPDHELPTILILLAGEEQWLRQGMNMPVHTHMALGHVELPSDPGKTVTWSHLYLV